MAFRDVIGSQTRTAFSNQLERIFFERIQNLAHGEFPALDTRCVFLEF